MGLVELLRLKFASVFWLGALLGIGVGLGQSAGRPHQEKCHQGAEAVIVWTLEDGTQVIEEASTFVPVPCKLLGKGITASALRQDATTDDIAFIP